MHKWINVEDGYPEDKQLVAMFYQSYGDIVIGYYSQAEGFGMSQSDRITHYIPLPDPPWEEDEEE